MKKYLNEGVLGLIIGVVAFPYFISTGLTREKITSDGDLVEIRTPRIYDTAHYCKTQTLAVIPRQNE